jgi:MYXO-CTERM domain-containing protein
VACVSAANAGVVDPFTNAETAYATSAAQPATPVTGGLFNQRNIYKGGGGSGDVSGGFVNFVPSSTGTNPAFWMVYTQANGSSIDLSGITSMSFDIIAGGDAYSLFWIITDSTNNAIDLEITGSLGVTTGAVTFTFPGSGDPGFNYASVKKMEVVFRNGDSTSTGQLSNFNYTAVPAPGALALLGVAGIVGARRRRD